MNQPVVRAPRYLSRFRCIGAACEDNCCAGWQNVDVDLETYRRLQTVDHPALAPAIRQHLRPNPEPAGPEDVALIQVPEGGCCPFLGDGLCAIQTLLGERLLPAGCDTFPRQATLIDGQIDLAGRLSCPEVARLALLQPDALEIHSVDADRRLAERAADWVELPWVEPPPADPRRVYHRLREQCADLLRRADATLNARLQALGLALTSLQASPAVDVKSVEQCFTTTVARLPGLQRQLETASEPAGPSALLLARIRPWLEMRGVPPRYRACLERLRIGLELPDDPEAAPGERTRCAYAAALPLLQNYVRRRPYVLQNLLLNHVQVSNFPYHPDHSFMEEHALLVCRYGLLRLHLVGAAAAAGDLTDELVVETMQAFDKYPDSPDYWRRTLSLLRAAGMLEPAGLASLLQP